MPKKKYTFIYLFAGIICFLVAEQYEKENDIYE